MIRDDRERKALAQLALGRLFRIMSRPFQPGDHEQFEQIREILLGESNEHPIHV